MVKPVALRMIELILERPTPLDDALARTEEIARWTEDVSSQELVELLSWLRDPSGIDRTHPLADAWIHNLREEGCIVAGRIGKTRGDDSIRLALENLLEDEMLRQYAIQGLTGLSNARTISRVQCCIDSADYDTIYLIVVLLEEDGSQEALSALEFILRVRGGDARINSLVRSGMAEISGRKASPLHRDQTD